MPSIGVALAIGSLLIYAYIPDVISIHVVFWAAMYDPLGKLSATTTSQHHTWQKVNENTC